ncbi:hypothetical protein ACFRAU_08835 [Arthrobacter sp. NPDC056691]|uniref:hypothetical protein n=1 Tax=unclassified Arthrobacter TaxID=235627 RepID=UPI00367202B7
MMSPDPYSPGDSHWQSPTPERLPARHAAGVPAAAPDPARGGHRPAQHAPRGGILQRQLMRLIGEILGDEGLDPETRLSLLRNISEHPGHPERAMLAHLHEMKDRS